MSPVIEFIGLYLGANAVSFVIFGLDKLAARTDQRRVPERSLLLWAMFGWLGAKAGQRIFRHKTRKQPFARHLNLVGVAHVILTGAAALWALGFGL